MNDAKLCDLTRPLRAVGCHHDIPTRPSQLDHGPKRTGTSTRTRPTYRFVAEPRDDPCDDFPIVMLADQHMGTGSSVTDRNHQLLSMPKRENDAASFPIQPIDCLVASGFTVHRARDAANGGGSERREE